MSPRSWDLDGTYPPLHSGNSSCRQAGEINVANQHRSSPRPSRFVERSSANPSLHSSRGPARLSDREPGLALVPEIRREIDRSDPATADLTGAGVTAGEGCLQALDMFGHGRHGLG